MNTSIFGRINIQSVSYKRDYMHKSLLIGIYCILKCYTHDIIKIFCFKLMSLEVFKFINDSICWFLFYILTEYFKSLFLFTKWDN